MTRSAKTQISHSAAISQPVSEKASDQFGFLRTCNIIIIVNYNLKFKIVFQDESFPLALSSYLKRQHQG